MERVVMYRGRRVMRWAVLLLMLSFVFIVGCSKSESDQLAMQGKELFTSYCIHCHGPSGIGDGFNAEFLDPRPRDLTDTFEVFLGELSNEDIYGLILSRDIMDPAEAERLLDEALENDTELPFMVPPAMPTFKYTLSDAERWALVAYVRTLHKNDAPSVKVDETVNTLRPVFPIRQAPSWDIAEETRLSLVEQGKFLFADKYNCVGCHAVSGYGGKVGPDLSQSGARLSSDWLYQWISNPQAMKTETKMPNLGLTKDEAKAITLYLGSLT